MNGGQVMELLNYFDNSSDIPLHNSLDFEKYSVKLSENAYFIIASEKSRIAGFMAYYYNEVGGFIYIPQIVVHNDYQHRGIGHAMFLEIYNCLSEKYKFILLEVLKTNRIARAFYEKEGFVEKEDRGDKFLLEKCII